MAPINPELFREKIVPFALFGNGCWNWKAGKDWDGYGIVKVNKRSYRAHRVSYEAWFGKFDHSKWVLHNCDNPSCIRPDHLRIGSAKENNDDRDSKGRQARGERNAATPLTEQDVRQMHCLYRSGLRMGVLMQRFGISRHAISLILRGKSWKHLNLPELVMHKGGRPAGIKETRPRRPGRWPKKLDPGVNPVTPADVSEASSTLGTGSTSPP